MFRIPSIKCEPQNILLDKYIKPEHDIAHEHNIKHEHIDESTEYKLDYNGYYNQSTYQCYTDYSKNTKENVEVPIKFEVDIIDDVIYENICMRDDNDLPSVASTNNFSINSHIENKHTSFNLNIESSSTATFTPTKNKVMKSKKNDQIQNEVHTIDDVIFESFVSHDNNYMPSAESRTYYDVNTHVENKPTNFNLNIKSSTTPFTPTKHEEIIFKKNNQIITEVDKIDDVKCGIFCMRDNIYVPDTSTTSYSINSQVEKKPTNRKLNIKASTTHCKPTKSKAITSIKNVEKLHNCFIYNKSFSTNSNMKIHSRIHTGKKPYQCSICNKSFSYNGSMKNHSRIHTGEKPYQCLICNKSFKYLSGFNSHKIIHKSHKPFSCAICEKSFSWKVQILKHTNEHKSLL